MIRALIALACSGFAQEPPRPPLELSAWVVPWDQADAAGGALSCFGEINPFAYELDQEGGLRLAYPSLLARRRAGSGPRVVPVVVNDVTDARGKVNQKSPEALAALLSDGSRLEARAAALVGALPLDEIDGVEIDFEKIPFGAWPQYVEFLRLLGLELHARGKTLAIDVEVSPLLQSDGGRATIGEAARQVDAVKVMAYYQRGAWAGDAGPGSSLSWIEDVARRALAVVPAEKLSIALSLAGTDWRLPYPRVVAMRRVTRLHYGKVLELLATRRGKQDWSEGEQAPFFDYEENGERHRLWYEDERSIAAKLEAVRRAGVARAAIWYVGKRHPDFSTSGPCRR